MNRARHFGTWGETIRSIKHGSSARTSELLFEYFGTSAKVSGQFGPTKPLPKCIGPEVSGSRARNSVAFQHSFYALAVSSGVPLFISVRRP